MNAIIELEQRYANQNYIPVPVVFTKGEGVYLWDDAGKRYLDMMSAYSAVSHGHRHPRLIKALTEQAQQLAMLSRAFHHDKLGIFLQRACELTGQERALPMNSGAEAVETAVKTARKWAYDIKGVAENQAEIIVCNGNFHGRTTTIISFSSEPLYKKGFGPLTPGFKFIPYGDAAALQAAINKNTAAFLVEPIQGEGGIHVPPSGYLKQCAEICKKNNVLLLADEIQCGLGRTGKLLACDHDNVKPDGLILGKALGGGLLPVSLFLSSNDIMQVMGPGTHGSTFGGSPLASAVALTALDILIDEGLIDNAAKLGEYLLKELQKIDNPLIKDIRGKGLFVGIEIDPQQAAAKDLCLQLIDKGIVTRETHQTVIRLAPPLVINQQQIDEALKIIRSVL